MVTRGRLVAALVVVALALGSIGLIYLSHGDGKAEPAPKTLRRNATFTPEARRVANEFLAAVGRMDRARARRLLAPTAPCSRMVVPAGLFKPADVHLSVGWAQPNHLFLDAVIRRKDNGYAVFMMGLQRHRRNTWRVDYWDVRWGPLSPWCEAQTSN